MMNLLDDIVSNKRVEIQKRRKVNSISLLMDTEYYHREARSLINFLRDHPKFGIIAEIKRASPTAGIFGLKYQPAEIVRMYEESGASAISILTDEKFFSGSLNDLQTARRTTNLPLLRKDFIIDEFQLFESKAFGADAVLLIASVLDKNHLHDLYNEARELGLDVLVELYETKEIDKMDFDTMKLVGINNRDLRTFSVDIRRSIELATLLPRDVFVVSESGIGSAVDLITLWKSGIHAALIGESLMKSDHPGKALKTILNEFSHATQS
jgi:indole-3-glycerol phosphate synthase